MGYKVADIPQRVNDRRTYHLFDDFDWYISPHVWTSLAADMGVTAPVRTDGRGGLVSMATGATDNNEVMVATTGEVLLMGDGLSGGCEVLLQFTEANTDDANVCIGFGQEAGANILLDNGGGPATTLDGALIYKVDGGTVWRCVSSAGTTQTLSTSTTTAGGAAYQRLRILFESVSDQSDRTCVTFWVDGQQLIDSTTLKPICHYVTHTTFGEGEFIAGYIKAGGANSETLLLDYAACWQLRHRGQW